MIHNDPNYYIGTCTFLYLNFEIGKRKIIKSRADEYDRVG